MEDSGLVEDSVRIDKAYVELQSNKYYMYGLGFAGIISTLMSLKCLMNLIGVYTSTADSTAVDFLELFLVVLLFFEIGFVVRAAQLDSLENIKHKTLGSDCLLAFFSLICFLVDNFVRARVMNSILELIWTVPYTMRAFFAVKKSASAVKDEKTSHHSSSKLSVLPTVSKSTVATAVLGRLARF